MEKIYKNHIKIGDYIIQYENGWSTEKEKGYHIMGPDGYYGCYNHVFDAIEEVLQWQDN